MKRKNNVIALFTILLFLPFSVSVSLAAGQFSQRNDCFSTAWPQENSDLEPDPDLLYGRLQNGFRYVLMENHEPRKRVGLYLNVQAGSLCETDIQRGAAHFLEHMLFNGSEHFKPGELVKYFQGIGMDFGSDTNAHTTYDETVYKIILPSGETEEIDRGLLVMADYARGALLLETEINRERGVILSEKRSRDSASYRTHVESSKYSLMGTKLPLRKPIGTLETLQNIDRTILKNFYDSWYRPNNIILVMVGDFHPASIEPLIRKHFEGLEGDGSEPDCPAYGRLQQKDLTAFYHFEPELGGTNISIESIWNQPQVNDSLPLKIKEMKEYIVSRLMNNRIEQLLELPDTPFTDSSFYAGDILGFLGYTGITATTSPEKWQKSLVKIENTLRQALEYGFKNDELLRVKKEVLSQLNSEVSRASTRNSQHLARQIIRSINENRVFQSPQQELELYEEIIDITDLAEVNNTLKQLWSTASRQIEVTGNAHLAESPETTIQQLYLDAGRHEVAKWEMDTKVVFPYLTHSKSGGKPVATQRFQEIGVERYIFENGVVINVKQTDYKKNFIELRLNILGGRLAEPKAGMGMLAEAVVNESGSGHLRKTEIEKVLAGSTVSYDFSVEKSNFSWRGNALSKDLKLLLQVMHTVVVDPGFRKEVFGSIKESYKQSYQMLERDIQGGMKFHVKKFLAGGQPSFGWPAWEDLSAVTFSQLQKWISEALNSGELEISIVGDFDKEELLTLCASYFGSLEKRNEQKNVADKIEFPTGKMIRRGVASSIDKALVVLAWPTADFWNIQRTRRLHMLAKIFDDRLRVVVREKLGAAYAPVVYNFSSRNFENYGFLLAQMVVEPRKADQVREAVLDIAAKLQKNGITAEELERAKAPTLTSLKDMVRTNRYWLNSVLANSYRYPQQLQWPQTILTDYGAVKKEEINALARRYLLPESVATAVIEPEL